MECALEDLLLQDADDDDAPLLFDDDSSSTSSSASADSYDLAQVLSAAKMPKFDDVVPTFDPVDSTPTVLKALNQMTSDVAELNIRVVDYYANLRAVSPLLSPVVAPRGHVHGGSIATTTDQK